MPTLSQNTPEIGRLFPPDPDASTLTVYCAPSDYAASFIARAVEDCDAQVLNLNVLAESPAPPLLAVEVRVTLRDPSPVVRSLARYGMDAVVNYSPAPPAGAEDSHRISALERFLNI